MPVPHRIIATLCFLAVTHSAHAGPWLREKGSTFTAVSVSGTYFLESASQTYLEYGLTSSTTVIADISTAGSQFALPSGSATASLRRALSKPEASSKWAYEVGVGVGWVGEYTMPHIRTALSWGKGITLAETSGWVTVDAAIIWDITSALHVTKLDTTLGMNFTDVTSGMIQIYSNFTAGEGSVTIAPSLVFNPGGKNRYQISTESEIGNIPNTALKIALWRTF